MSIQPASPAWWWVNSNFLLILLAFTFSSWQSETIASERPRTDPILIAARVFKKVTGTPKNPAAVALGKLAGPKGGPASAKALPPERRSEIAGLAALKRWADKR